MRRGEYRSDIDGLRAIAVLLVILHHYRVTGFSGGFVGVDVFFVISGFLIAGHIKRDLLADRFSLLGFYERRIRRILPALFTMYAVVLIAASVILFPPDLHFLSRIGAYVIPFLANYELHRTAGPYGGQFADHVILLHTWSLAVEEQFYLFFPLLMLAIAGLCRGRYATVIWPLVLASLISCILEVRLSTEVAFYLAPFRAWELLGGALLAVGKFSAPRTAWLRMGTAVSGLLLLAIADLRLTDASLYPGELTLLPCVGAVLILHAGCDRSDAVGRLLGSWVMRRIGLWSYSLYLYHWPLLLLAQYYALTPLSVSMRCVLLATTFLLGALSWRYVEQPFRGRNAVFSRPSLFAAAAGAGTLLLVATFVTYRLSEPTRYDALERSRFPTVTSMQTRCRGASPEVAARPVCILGDSAAPVSALLWGDSHALAILPAVSQAFARHHAAAAFAQSNGCPPLKGTYVGYLAPGQSATVRAWLNAAGWDHGAECKRQNDAVLQWILQSRIQTVILAGHWIANTEEQYLSVLTDAESPGHSARQNDAAVFARGMERLLVVLQHAQVRIFVVDDVPQNPLSVPYALASARRLHLQRDFRISRSDYELQQRSATQIFAQLSGRYALRMLTPQDVLCGAGRCAIEDAGASLYVDAEHLAPAGALLSEPAFEPIFEAARQ